ncbi:MAG: hypothetical protein ACK5X3_15755, partial [Pseudomonadota bacterium]
MFRCALRQVEDASGLFGFSSRMTTMADKAISDRGKAGGAAKPAGTPNGTKATQSTNAVTGRAGQPP